MYDEDDNHTIEEVCLQTTQSLIDSGEDQDLIAKYMNGAINPKTMKPNIDWEKLGRDHKLRLYSRSGKPHASNFEEIKTLQCPFSDCDDPKHNCSIPKSTKQQFKNHCIRYHSDIIYNKYNTDGDDLKPFKCGSCRMAFVELKDWRCHLENTHNISQMRVNPLDSSGKPFFKKPQYVYYNQNHAIYN